MRLSWAGGLGGPFSVSWPSLPLGAAGVVVDGVGGRRSGQRRSGRERRWAGAPWEGHQSGAARRGCACLAVARENWAERVSLGLDLHHPPELAGRRLDVTLPSGNDRRARTGPAADCGVARRKTRGPGAAAVYVSGSA